MKVALQIFTHDFGALPFSWVIFSSLYPRFWCFTFFVGIFFYSLPTISAPSLFRGYSSLLFTHDFGAFSFSWVIFSSLYPRFWRLLFFVGILLSSLPTISAPSLFRGYSSLLFTHDFAAFSFSWVIFSPPYPRFRLLLFFVGNLLFYLPTILPPSLFRG